MRNLEELRKSADSKRAVFLTTLDGAVEQLRPVRVADAALAALDPQFTALKRLKQKVRTNPLFTLAAAAGFVLFYWNVRVNGRSTSAGNRVRRSRLAHSTPKGGQHGQFSKTEQQ